MKPSIRSLTLVLAFAAAALLGRSAAQAQTVISVLPYTISTNGSYVLNSNLNSSATTGHLITINASNVTLDFQNHYIAGPANNTSSSLYGIYANEQSNLNIKNGTVAYCTVGIYISGNGTASTNNVDQQVNNMRVTYSYYSGIDIRFAPASVVSACQVSQTGFSTSTTGSIGINIDGAGVVVQGCTVSNVISSAGGAHGTYGIFSAGGSFTRQCQVSNAYIGISEGIYQDNLASACTNAFTGGTDGGGNYSDGTAATNSFPASTSKQR